MNATSNVTRNLKILVVDDEHLVADSLVEILNLVGFDASSGYSGSQAIDKAAGSQIQLTSLTASGLEPSFGCVCNQVVCAQVDAFRANATSYTRLWKHLA